MIQGIFGLKNRSIRHIWVAPLIGNCVYSTMYNRVNDDSREGEMEKCRDSKMGRESKLGLNVSVCVVLGDDFKSIAQIFLTFTPITINE